MSLTIPKGSSAPYYQVSVLEYGARGDGVTDDTAAIQAAITAGAGKKVYFPAGVYVITGTLSVTSDDTRLVGDGSGIARYSTYDAGGGTALLQTTVNTSSVLFQPASSATQYLYGAGIQGISISYSSAAANTQTSGTGVTFTRCNGYVLDDVTVNDAFECIAVKGGYDGRLHNFRVTGNYIDRVGYPPSGYNGLVTFKSSSYDGIYQGCQVVAVSDFTVVQGKVRNYTVIIESGDGINFSNGYIGNAVEANVLVRPTVDGTSSSTCDYVSAVAFSNVYIDGVQTTSTTTLGAKRCVTITNASGSYLAVYDVTFGSGCYFANAVEDLFVVEYTRTNGCRIAIDGATLSNATNNGIVVDGPNASSAVDVILSDNFITTVGEATYGAVKIGDVRSLVVTGNHILTTDGCALYLLGTINNGIVSNNYNNSVLSDVVNVASVTGRLTFSGNGGAYTGANTWRGFNPGNIASASTDRLDWYQEGTFTPALSFGGGTTGITYTSRTGDYTRIGNVVYVRVNFLLSSKGSDAGQVWITAMPYAASSTGTDFALSVRFTSVTSGVGDTMITARVIASGTTIFLEKYAAGARVVLTEADLTNTTAVTVTGMYFV